MDIRILFVSANPNSTRKLDLAEELRQFQHSLSGHDVKLLLLPAAQPEDLRIAIKSKQIDIVHFSGHAKTDGILMRDEGGNEVLVPREELKALFEEKRIKLVVLNACNTSGIADDIKDSVGAVIGTSDLLDERAAKMLSKVFYSALGRGDTIGSAYAEATKAISDRAPQKNVYMAHGLTGDVKLLPGEKAEDKDIEIEGKEPFDRYYYVDYLDEQISSLTANRKVNLTAFWILLGLGLVFLFKSWNAQVLASIYSPGQPHPDDGGLLTTISQFITWIWDGLMGLFTESHKETPLLDWLAKVGPAIPAFMATMQARWCVHSGEKIRQLIALRELVRNSDNLTQDLRIRLHKILDQSLSGAQEPTTHATFLPSLYYGSKTALTKMFAKMKSIPEKVEAR